MEQETLHSIVSRAEENYTNGNSKLGKYVDWSMYETIETIFSYLNSKHVSGLTDSLGREKPFFNIVSAAVNIWYRATDIDRKDIIVLPNSQNNIAAAFLATILLQDWMKRARFGVFLNSWGRTLAQYGSAVVKFVEKDGELSATVVPWNRMIVDPIDFNALPRIEKFYKTPAQLKNMATPNHPDYVGYDLDTVNSIIEKVESRKTIDGEQKDNQNDFIECYEVHGLLSQAVYNQAKGLDYDDKDENIFFQQMHVITTVSGSDGEGVNFTLYSGKEKKDPYMITHLIEEEGRTLSIGAVEYLFDTQWMVNHTMKQWKDQMDLASKLIFQTADQTLLGKNVLKNLETGDILLHAVNSPIELVPNTGHDITNLKAFAEQWRLLGQEVTSTPDAARGVTPPSGTALGTVQITTAQGLSLFEIMTENKANALEQMLREHIIPFLKTKLNNQDEVVAVLEDRDIKTIDSIYVPREAVKRYNKKVIDTVLAGEIPSGLSVEQEATGVKQELSTLGNKRFFTPGEITWSEVLKDLEWKLDVGISNETSDKQAVLTTLSSLFQTVASNPMVLTNPDAKLVFNKILSFTNAVSPIELSSNQSTPQQPATPITAPPVIGQPQS